MNQETIASVLLAEYDAVRQEIRMIIASMDTGLNALMIVLGGLGSVWAVLRDDRVLFVGPTIIAFFGLGQLMRATSSNILGTYCQAIECRIRQLCGEDQILMHWEGSPIWRAMAAPSGPVQVAFVFIFLAGAAIFCGLAYRAYLWWWPSAVLHAAELALVATYGVISFRWNNPARREERTRELLGASTSQHVIWQGSQKKREPARSE